jgi:hypothetical protein
MRIRGLEHKLGALCRWVRELDAMSGLSGAVGRSTQELEKLRVLDMILRVTGPVDASSSGRSLRRHSSPSPSSRSRTCATRARHPSQVRESVLEESIFSYCGGEDVKTKFHVIETTPGPERKPPNLHPAIIYLTEDNIVSLASEPPAITRHAHPRVPNLTLLKGVLSPAECQAIRRHRGHRVSP